MNQVRRQVLLLIRNRAHGAAVREAFEAARKNPTLPECFELLAYAEAMAGYTKAAVKTISHAIQLAPERPAYWFQRGQLHLAGNALAEAISDMRRVVQIEQDAGTAQFTANAELLVEEALSRVPKQAGSGRRPNCQAA